MSASQLWLDNCDTLASLESTFSSLVNYYTATAIRGVYRQNLAMAKLNAVGALLRYVPCSEPDHWKSEQAASYDISNAFMQVRQ